MNLDIFRWKRIALTESRRRSAEMELVYIDIPAARDELRWME